MRLREKVRTRNVRKQSGIYGSPKEPRLVLGA